MAKKHKNRWFIKIRGSYLPASWQGWLTYLPFIAYLVTAADLAVKQTKSIGFILLTVVPQWLAAAIILTWLAERKS